VPDVPDLAPNLVALARTEGAAAGRAVLAGKAGHPCRWDANGPSLTASRMAHHWAQAFLEVNPEPAPLPPEL
jgi:hypothetical protein